ncbi:hypothetical protein F2P81_020042 [Scophthalmus maximus]|uniref:Uncharacterized protein n=1 Tax=Scophthalmus maximus TaxID=52904 RepID=A0A6A4S880_SCOMX|nr:hypothetical protein F2P81_020042 [Scophthalmus maximus]
MSDAHLRMSASVGTKRCRAQKEAGRHFQMESRNFVSDLHEYARRSGAEAVYEDLGSGGPDHDKTFTQRVVLNGKVYPEAVGKTKKKAKQNAAENALNSLLSNKPVCKFVYLYRFTSEFDSISCLGYGGFGHVYKAREKLLDKYYAVKVVHDREWSVSKSSQYLYIKMELCDTKTLKGWINERNETTPQESKRRVESVTIAQQIVNGVEYIHAKKLIHRDLKPANVMFGRDGEVKIGDFGLVTAEADDENKMERTIETGTLSYMAPEQKSEKTYDGKVDIFAFGLIYFELLLKVSSGHERAEYANAVDWQSRQSRSPDAHCPRTVAATPRSLAVQRFSSSAQSCRGVGSVSGGSSEKASAALFPFCKDDTF